MATNKTAPTESSTADYIAAISPAIKQADAQWLLHFCERITGEKAKMWGTSIVGCGSYHYKYESGREGEMMLVGFAARKTSLVAYIVGEVPDQKSLLAKLGKHKMGKACLYINKLSDIDLDVFEELALKSIAATKAKYPD